MEGACPGREYFCVSAYHACRKCEVAKVCAGLPSWLAPLGLLFMSRRLLRRRSAAMLKPQSWLLSLELVPVELWHRPASVVKSLNTSKGL